MGKERDASRSKRRKAPLAARPLSTAASFLHPNSVEHILSPTDSVQTLLIHYGTSAAALRALNPGKSDAMLMFAESVVVPWPKFSTTDRDGFLAPCLTCVSHGWCMAIRAAAETGEAPVLPSSQDDLEQAALRKVSQLLLNASGGTVTYSRVKAKLIDEFGSSLVDRIKPRVREMLQEAAEDSDRHTATASPSSEASTMTSSASEPSWARTCLFERTDTSNDEDAAAAAADDAIDDVSSGRGADSPVDVGALQMELDHWEDELDKLSCADSEEELTLKICLQTKVDALKSELKDQNALLGESFTGYLASLDARFAKARDEAVSAAATSIESACSCCGVIIRPGAQIPDGCTYRSTVGAHFPAAMESIDKPRATLTKRDFGTTERHTRANEELFAL